MRKEYAILFYIACIAITIVLSFIFMDYTIPIPFPLPFGMLFTALFLFMNLSYELFRGASPQVVSNIRHYSINTTKDIKRIPWHSNLMTDDDMKNQSLGELYIMFPGGVESWYVSAQSSSDYPVFIFPSIYAEKEGESYRITANLMKYDFTELPLYIQYALLNYGSRVNPKSTPIYYGVTSHIDGSATPANMKILLRERSDNKLISELETKLKTIYKELRRDDERKTRTRLVKPFTELEE
jgi:hypothetical protein